MDSKVVNENAEVDRGIVITKLFAGTFETEIGKRCLDHLKKTFVDRPVYLPGATHDETAFREGQRNIVMQIMKELNNGN